MRDSASCRGGVARGTGDPSTAAVLGRTARGLAGRSRPRGLDGRGLDGRMPGLPAVRVEAAGLARRYGAAVVGRNVPWRRGVQRSAA